jgi:asparagine synthetase B (glutamine-hydrolysing)
VSSLGAILVRRGRPDPAQLRRLLEASPHRGTPATPAELGAAIVGVTTDDVGDTSIALSGDLVAAVVGSFDDGEALGAELTRAGIALTGTSPADLLLGAHRAWGSGCIERLRGTFACVVTDGRTLWCSRDHHGFRTLFYRDDADAFVVATEAKQVAAGAGIAAEPDLDVLEAIFYSEYDDDTPSALRGVRRQPKATTIRAEEQGSRIRRYWYPERLLETARLGDDELAEAFQERMRVATARSLGGDDVVALSGGIDSPAVAAYAAPTYLERTSEPLAALSAVYPDHPECDETPYIEDAANAMGLKLHTFVRSAPIISDLQEWVRLFDGPAPQWTVSQGVEFHDVAKELGFRNIMTGEIAEFVIDSRQHTMEHLLLHLRLGALRTYVDSMRSKGFGRKRIARELLGGIAPPSAWAAYLQLRPPKDSWTPAWVTSRGPGEGIGYEVYKRPARERWEKAQVMSFFGAPGLSQEADSVVQAVTGMRVRRPFADVDLWEFFLSLPAEQKFPRNESKGLVRQLLRGRVPDSILDRTDKTHFNDYIMASVDYEELGRWVRDPQVRVRGVDYALLAQRLDARDLTLPEYIWAKDLAAVHAFLGLW